MAEYIDREAIMKAFADHVWNSNHSDLVPVPQWNHAVEIVRDYPAADVRPVVRGEWERVGNTDHFKCTCCNDRISAAWDTPSALINFCPNCGADMRGDVNNGN